MSTTSVYAGKRLEFLKSACKQKKIPYESDCNAEELVSLLEMHDEAKAEAKLQLELEAKKIEAETKAKLELVEAEAKTKLELVEAESRKTEAEAKSKVEILEAEARKNEIENRAKLELARIEKGQIPEGPAPSQDRQSPEEQKALNILKNLEENGDVDLYFDYFEKVLRTNNVPREKWGYLVAKVITGKALDAYTSLADEDLKNYDKVKSTILNRFSVGAEFYRNKFRNTAKDPSEGYAEFASRLSQNLAKWLEKLDLSKSYEKLVQALLLEQFYGCLPNALKVYLLDHKPANLNDAGSLAQQYTEHRSSVYGNDKTKVASPKGPRKNSNGSNVAASTNSSPKKNQGEKGAAKNGKSYNHYNRAANQNRSRTQNTNSAPSTSNTGEQRPRYTGCTICGDKTHRWSECEQRKPLHLSSFSREVGQNSLNESEFKARINGAPVNSLFDTGASVSLIESRLVNPHSFTGEMVHIRHAFSPEIITLPIAKVQVESDKVTGEIIAAVYTDLPYPFILSPNAQGQSGTINVVTRAQAKKEKGENQEKIPEPQVSSETQPIVNEGEIPELNNEQPESESETEVPVQPIQGPTSNPVYGPTRPNPALCNKALSHVTREELINEQRSDPELARYYTYASQVDNDKAVKYSVQEDLLVRQWSKHGLPDDQKFNANVQIVIPTSLRAKILSRIHDFDGGHFKTKRCTEKILGQFWWPRLTKTVKEYVTSCHACQKVGTPGDKHREKLVRVPLVPEPWSKLIVDVTGPLKVTKHGNKYILSVIDACTRYALGIPMLDQTAETIGSHLIETFCKFGWPREIQTDLGSNFRSDLIQILWEKTGVRHIFSSVHHPASQGAVEVLHRIIKNSLRAIIQEHPSSDWDQILPFVMFGIANSVNATLGFKPSELLFTRELRGPATITYDNWLESENTDCNLIELVLRQVNTAHDALKEAISNHDRESAKYKKYYDAKAKPQNLKAGQEVLVLRPSRKTKLDCFWTGPYTVIERVGDVNYRVALKGKHQIFHSNILKPYLQRPSHLVNLAMHVSFRDETPAFSPDNNPVTLDNLFDQIKKLEVSPSIKEKLTEVIRNHKDVFSNTPGKTHLHKFEIKLTNDQPVKFKAYKGNPIVTAMIKTELDKLLHLSLIYRCESSYGAPLFLVQREGKDPRPCINYKALNTLTVPDNYRIPCMEQLVEKLAASRYITLFDLSRGFFQVVVDKESRKYTAMTTPFGNFAWNRMPMGLRNSPAAFQRTMDIVLQGAENYASCYIDDVAVFSNTIEDHVVHLQDVLGRIHDAGLTVKPGKTKIAQAEVEYLGKTVGAGTIKPQLEKIRAIREYPIPLTRRHIRQFLGLVGFYHKWIKDYASIAKPLTDCLRKAEWKVLPPQAAQSVEQLKEALCSAPVLTCPAYDREMILETDASAIAVSAILSQCDDEGTAHPIAYASRKLQERETRYSASELEMLAIIFGLQKYKVYLLCMKVKIVTDHSALTYLHNLVSHNAKLARWSLILESYNYTIIHRKGKLSQNVDSLSRVSIDE